VLGITKTVALEVARTGVTCNAICPGFTRTPLAERQVVAAAKERGISEEQALTDVVLEKQPSKRWVEVEEVARLALYVCGPDTGSLNGAALSIDGGWIAA
jgi:3-hydroxybutyrate dehydrogenase